MYIVFAKTEDIATLNEYLRKYKTNEDQRDLHFESFTKYIVARCWRKMHRRINSSRRRALLPFLPERAIPGVFRVDAFTALS